MSDRSGYYRTMAAQRGENYALSVAMDDALKLERRITALEAENERLRVAVDDAKEAVREKCAHLCWLAAQLMLRDRIRALDLSEIGGKP